MECMHVSIANFCYIKLSSDSFMFFSKVAIAYQFKGFCKEAASISSFDVTIHVVTPIPNYSIDASIPLYFTLF